MSVLLDSSVLIAALEPGRRSGRVLGARFCLVVVMVSQCFSRRCQLGANTR